MMDVGLLIGAVMDNTSSGWRKAAINNAAGSEIEVEPRHLLL